MSRFFVRRLGAALVAVVLGACSSATDPGPTQGDLPTPSFSTSATDPAAELATLMDNINLALDGQAAGYRLAVADYVTDGSGGEAGGTVLSKVLGNKRLGSDFVPNDPRRGWSGPVGGGDNITYAVDQTGDAVPPFGGLTGAVTDAAIGRAMTTWDGVSCSDLQLTRAADFGLDIGVIAFLNGLGGSPFVFADLQHAGWRDINFAGGILGVTFTFIFVNGGVPPTSMAMG